MIGFLFILRIFVSWVLLFLLLMLLLSGLTNGDVGWLFGVLVIGALIFVIPKAYSHVRRVRLIAGRADWDTLAIRHRRQIEIPLGAGEAFDLIEAALQELPRGGKIESARDSLQLRAKVRRYPFYDGPKSNRSGPGDAAWEEAARKTGWFSRFGNHIDQVTITITPGAETSSAMLLCEPDSPAWRDHFSVDYGINLENIEGLTRAITRRLTERRRGEHATLQQTATEKELTVAKLSLLHAQVEPHFLYNTLASAQLLTRSDPARADQMLGHLIAYLRHSLPRTEQTFSTLGEELERANAYLEILKIRMGARLTTKIDVAPALQPVPFPPMMLQTLVENAIKHGLEPKPEGGKIWVLAKANDRDLSVTVADDGHGLHMESSGTGIGLKNVRERLRLLYGPAASFNLVSNFPAGVAATIVVPAMSTEARPHA